MVADSDPHIIGITESWANKDITDAECFGKIGREEGVEEYYTGS